MNNIRLSNLIAPSFFEAHSFLNEERYTHWWFSGGRGSTKSSFVSIEIVLGIMKNPHANAVALRKVGNTVKDSVFEQFKWAIDKLGVPHLWQIKLSPLELVYKTGQRIIFRGADDVAKIKSLKVSKGYVRYIWYEELTEFDGMEEIRSVNQSLMRGGKKFDVFYSYNPPLSIQNWVNLEAANGRDDRYSYHGTYLDVPQEWLGEQFIIEAEHLKKTHYNLYRHEYLGEAVGTGGEVFENLKLRTLSEQEIGGFDSIRRGIDFGYAADPFVYVLCNFEAKHRRLYIFGEIFKRGLSNRRAYELIGELGSYCARIVCDSAEPKSINELRSYGLNAVGARKGPDSIEYGIKFLQSLDEIVIDPKRCPETAREFSTYALERDRDGNFRDGYPDKNNHSIDAVRYALEFDCDSRRGKIIERKIFE